MGNLTSSEGWDNHMTDDAVPPMAYSQIEQEAIVLKSALDMIGDMVNFSMFLPFGRDASGADKTQDTNLMFADASHTRLFNILLGDFLGKLSDPIPFDLPVPPENSPPSDLTFLFYLRRIAAAPKLGVDAELISEPVEAFATWLEKTATAPRAWFPSVGVECDMKVKRIKFLKLCGDMAKHNLARLSVNERMLGRLFRQNGHPLGPGQAYLVMPDFYEWFHRNIFIYHSSTIAEFLNNIRWGIHRYLAQCFEGAFVTIADDQLPRRYTFKSPEGVSDPLACEMFFDLMNTVMRPPSFPQFTVNQSLKRLY